MQVGVAGRRCFLPRVEKAFGDPRLYALSVVVDELAQCPAAGAGLRVYGRFERREKPERILGTLLELLVAEKSGFRLAIAMDPAGSRSSASVTKEAARVAGEWNGK